MVNDNQRTPSERNISIRLYQARVRRSIDRDELAKKVGVCTRIIYDYESGAKCPSLITLCRLADALGISVDDLLF